MAYIGNSPTNIQRGRRAVYEFTASAGQTAFSGVDNNGLTLDLLDSNENDVYLNGARLVLTDDYTISGDTLTLVSAAALNDVLVVVTQDDIANAGSYTKAESDSRYINYNGDIVNGDLQVVGNVSIGDNNTFNVGGSNDLQIFHDGTHTYIDETNPTGYLFIRGANIQLLNPSNDIHLEAVSNGSVDLYYDNAKKFATTSTGVEVTGRVSTVGITSNDNSHIFTSPSYNIIDFISDNNDDGSNDDIIVNFRNGSAGTIKAELRWDESSDTFEISRADNRGDLVLAANGNVGIGVTNPGYKLHVQGNSLGLFASGGNTTTPSLTWGADASHILRTEDSELAIGLANTAPYNLYLQARTNASLERALIINPIGGNVGIGTTNPSFKLTVNGNAYVYGNNNDTYGQVRIVATNGGDAQLTFGTDLNGGGMYYDNSDTNKLKFYTGYGKGYAGKEVTIDNNANVGIGTTNPQYRLHTIGHNVVNVTNTSPTDGTGDVRNDGFGFKVATSDADVLGALINTSPNGNWGANIHFNVRNGGGGSFPSTPAMTIESDSNNVGIGISNPDNRLEINGPIKMYGSGSGQSVEWVYAQAGSFSTCTIEIQYPGAGSYIYEVGVAGTSGCNIQFGGGYTNGVGNFSHTASPQVGNGWNVSSPSSNLVRLISSGGVGTHPTAYVKTRWGLSGGLNASNISVTFS